MTPEVIDMLKRQGLVEDRDQSIMEFDAGGSVGDGGDGGTGAASSAAGGDAGPGAAGTGNGTGDGAGGAPSGGDIGFGDADPLGDVPSSENDVPSFATSDTDPAQTALANLISELGITPTEAAMMSQSNATGSNVATNGMTMAELSVMAANGLGNVGISSTQTVNQALASMAVHSGLNNNIGQIMGAIGGPVVGAISTAANAIAQGHAISSVVGQIAASIVGTALSNATGVAISANTVTAIANGQIGQAAMGVAIGQVAQATGLSVASVTAAMNGNLGGAVANSVTGAVVSAAAQSMSAGPLGGMALGAMASLSGIPASIANSVNQSAIGQAVNSVTSSISSSIASSGIGVPGASAGISTSAGAAAIADAVSAAENPPRKTIFGINFGTRAPKSQSQLLIDAVNSGKLPAAAVDVPQAPVAPSAPSNKKSYWDGLYSDLSSEFSRPPERPVNNTPAEVTANQAKAETLFNAGKEYTRLFGSLTPSAAEAIISSDDPLGYVDTLYTDESEAKNIWNDAGFGGGGSDEQLQQIIGLPEAKASELTTKLKDSISTLSESQKQKALNLIGSGKLDIEDAADNKPIDWVQADDLGEVVITGKKEPGWEYSSDDNGYTVMWNKDKGLIQLYDENDELIKSLTDQFKYDKNGNVVGRGLDYYLSAATDSIMRSSSQTASLLADVLPAMAAKAVGNEDYFNKQMAEAQATMKQINIKYPARVASYKNVNDLSSAATYVLESVMEGVVTTAPSLLMGGAAGVAARASAKAAMDAAIKKELAVQASKGVFGAEAIAAAQSAATKAGLSVAAKFTTPAILAASASQNVPEVFKNVYDAKEGKVDLKDLAISTLVGGFNAALDSVLPSAIVDRLNLSKIPVEQVIGAWYKNAAKEAGSAFVKEGGTEILQEMSSAAAESFLAENKDFFTKQNLDRFIDAGLKGGIGGSAVSTAFVLGKDAKGALSGEAIRQQGLDETTPAEYLAASKMFADSGFKATAADISAVTGGKAELLSPALAAEIQKYIDPRVVAEDEVRQALVDMGYTNPTKQEIDSFVGQRDEASTLKALEAQYDPLATTVEEATQMMRDLGYTNLTADEAKSLAGKIKEADAKKKIEEYVAPRQVTRTEAEQFFKDIGYKPTEADIAAFIRQGANINQDAVKREIGTYVDPRMVDEQEAKDAYAALGLAKPTQADVLKLVGQYDEAGLTGKATANLEAARYNSILSQLDSLSVGANKETLDAIDLVKKDLNSQITALGGDVSKLQSGVDSIAADLSGVSKEVEGVKSAIGSKTQTPSEADVAAALKVLTGKSPFDAKYDWDGNGKVDLNDTLNLLKASTGKPTTVPAGKDSFWAQPTGLYKEIQDSIQAAKDIGLEGDAALQAGLESLSSKMGVNQADLLAQLGTTAADLKTQFAADIATSQEATATEIANTRTALETAIAEAKAAGLEGDAALQTAIETVAADLGTTKEALLTQLGTTEETLRTEFETGITGLETQMKEQYEALTAEQKALADALTAQGTTLADAIAAAKGETQTQISELEAATKEQYEALTAEQKALADALTAQGTTLSDAIAAAQEQTQTQIGDLTADVQAKFDALTTEQKALATSLQQQGVDLNTAIETAQQQTQQQITDLGTQVDTRINELMLQGQTYQQATQQAFAEVNAKNQELSGLIGTQGRAANQSDIDALTQMLGGQRSMDLAYDVTGDKQITQADIDFLTQVVSGKKTDWMAPQQSPWAATGLYGQIQANELQRQKDLADAAAAAEAQRQADQQAAAERERKANIRTTATRAQTSAQGIMQQLEAMQRAGMAPQQPAQLVESSAGFDLSNPLNTGFFSGFQNKKAQQNQQPTTKIAAGGYIDDLLAENMTADDLLNLLR